MANEEEWKPRREDLDATPRVPRRRGMSAAAANALGALTDARTQIHGKRVEGRDARAAQDADAARSQSDRERDAAQEVLRREAALSGERARRDIAQAQDAARVSGAQADRDERVHQDAVRAGEASTRRAEAEGQHRVRQVAATEHADALVHGLEATRGDRAIAAAARLRAGAIIETARAMEAAMPAIESYAKNRDRALDLGIDVEQQQDQRPRGLVGRARAAIEGAFSGGSQGGPNAADERSAMAEEARLRGGSHLAGAPEYASEADRLAAQREAAAGRQEENVRSGPVVSGEAEEVIPEAPDSRRLTDESSPPGPSDEDE